MMKRNEWDLSAAPLDFDSSSGSEMVESEAVVEVESILHAEAAKAPSPSHVATSNVEPVDAPSRSEVDFIARGASPPALRGALH